MKTHLFKSHALIGLACLCLGMICCATIYAADKKAAAPAPGANDGGTLLVVRSPSVGSGIFVNLSIDGKQVSTLSSGKRYNGTLAPGKHVLSVVGDPNLNGQAPNRVEVNVEKGKAYAFTVTRKSGDIVLQTTGR